MPRNFSTLQTHHSLLIITSSFETGKQFLWFLRKDAEAQRGQAIAQSHTAIRAHVGTKLWGWSQLIAFPLHWAQAQTVDTGAESKGHLDAPRKAQA